MSITTQPPVPAILEGLRIIDCDAHFTEPPDLWTARVPDKFKGRVPVMETRNGLSAWYLDGEIWSGIGGNTIARGHEKVLGEHSMQPFDRIDESAWDVKARLRLMDEMNIHAAIIYPNGIGFASNHVFAIPDEEQRGVVLRVYNDFFMELQQESGNRLFPQAMLPIWDMDLTIAEMTRMLDVGVTGFTLSDKPELLGLPELDHEYFAPMWDLANESGTVLNFHIGSGNRRILKDDDEEMQQKKLSRPAESGKSDFYWSSFGPQRRLAVLATQMYMSNARIIVNMCMSNIFDRYPKLKIASAESGIGWIPFILESMEYQIDEMITTEDEKILQQRRPTEYFRDHFSVTFWFEQVGPAKLLEDVGVNNVLVETDIPHPTCLYPGASERLAKALGHLDPAIVRRVLQDNAVELYKLPMPSSP
ncbi:MAG: hypothetical protein QOI95_1998 [Acidimicrobiaceae bacterium]|jgi:predicted TIM-barrel fold metal-dependent hydrolase